MREKNLKESLKTAMFRPNSTAGYQGYQPDIKAFCTLDTMSFRPLEKALFSVLFPLDVIHKKQLPSSWLKKNKNV